MMFILKKKNLGQILNHWSEKYKVFAPQIIEGISQFHPVSPNSKLALNNAINTRYPPKSLFLPQSEVMLRYNQQLNKLENVKVLPEERIIFGIRSCDANAINLLDTIFDTEDYRDPYWTDRRSSSIIIGLGCNNPHSTCFCTSVGYGPFNPDGMDALMTEMDDVYFIKVFSEKGRTLFSELPSASNEEQNKVKRHQTQVAENMTIAFDTEGLKQTLDNLFESDYWEEITESCLGCGVCTFLCPTCFCFDIVDEIQRNERVRNWDTCMFRIYSQEASGHNPRPTRSKRTRQRLMHKFSYWLEQIGKIGCTGCGRCVRYCPVGLDLRAMLRKAKNFESEDIHAR
jgi:ferredoxin